MMPGFETDPELPDGSMDAVGRRRWSARANWKPRNSLFTDVVVRRDWSEPRDDLSTGPSGPYSLATAATCLRKGFTADVAPRLGPRGRTLAGYPPPPTARRRDWKVLGRRFRGKTASGACSDNPVCNFSNPGIARATLFSKTTTQWPKL